MSDKAYVKALLAGAEIDVPPQLLDIAAEFHSALGKFFAAKFGGGGVELSHDEAMAVLLMIRMMITELTGVDPDWWPNDA